MLNTNLKRYTVKEAFKDYEVTLEVNHDQLTVERATLINDFWSANSSRLDAENGDVARAVIRLFGQTMINMMLAEGGASFSATAKNRMTDEHPGPYWTKDLHNEEGWGGTENGELFGWCGIRVIAADVDAPGFDDVELEEVANG